MTHRSRGLAVASLLTVVSPVTAALAFAGMGPASTMTKEQDQSASSELRVAPRHDLVHVRASSGWQRVRFTIRNLDEAGNIPLACSVAGVVETCRLDAPTVYVGLGETRGVTVYYRVTAGGEGSVRLAAGPGERGRYRIMARERPQSERRTVRSRLLVPQRADSSGAPDAPEVWITPISAVLTAPELPVTIQFCHDRPLNAASRELRLNGVNVTGTFSYAPMSSADPDCLDDHWYESSGTLTLAEGSNSFSAKICDDLARCTTETATYTYDVPPPPLGPGVIAVDLSANPGDRFSRAACVTTSMGPAAMSCGELVMGHGMPAFTTQQTPRTLSLVYTSGSASPAGVVFADLTRPAHVVTPDSLRLTLRLKNHAGVWTSFQYTYNALVFHEDASTRRVSLPYNAIQAGLEGTGIYEYELVIRNIYDLFDGDDEEMTHSGRITHIDNRGSRYGRGWSVAGLERLRLPADTLAPVLLEQADGSWAHYARIASNTWRAPAGAYRDTLRYEYLDGTGSHQSIPEGFYFWRRGLDGTQWYYGIDGGMSYVRDVDRNRAQYVYRQVNGLRHPDNGLAFVRISPFGRNYRYTFAYSSQRLRSITDPAGRVMEITSDSDGRILSFRDPGMSASQGVSLGYYTAPDGRIRTWRSRRDAPAQTDTTLVTFSYGHHLPYVVGWVAPVELLQPMRPAFIEPVQLYGFPARYFTPGPQGVDCAPVCPPNYSGAHENSAALDSVWLIVQPATGETYEANFRTRFVVNRYGAPTSISTLPYVHSTRITYDATHPLLPRRIESPAPNEPDTFTLDDYPRPVTRFRYDASARLVWVEDSTASAGRDSTTYRYESAAARHLPTMTIRPRSATARDTVRVAYDAEGHPQTVTDERGGQTTFTYTGPGQVATVRNALDQVTTIQYDTLFQNPIAVTTPEGNRTEYELDAYGNVTFVTPPEGGMTRIVYNVMNWPVRSVVMGVDPDVDPGDTTVAAPRRSGPMRTSGLDSLVTDITYDADGNRLSITDPRGVVRSWLYDGRGFPVRETNGLGQHEYRHFYPSGNLGWLWKRDNTVLRHSYLSPTNRLTRLAIEWTDIISGEPVHQIVAEYRYDAAGNPVEIWNEHLRTRRTYAPEGSVVYESQYRVGESNADVTFDLAYNRDHTLAWMRQRRDNTRTNTYAYWPGGLLSEVRTTDEAETYTHRFAHSIDELGRVNRIEYFFDGPGAAEERKIDATFSYTIDGQLRNARALNHTGILFMDYDYAYDALGRPDTIRQFTSMDDYQRLTTYQYDYAGRMMHYTNDFHGARYAYDRSGNQTLAVSNSDSVVSVYHATENRLLSQRTFADNPTENAHWFFHYDVNGSLIAKGEQLGHIVPPDTVMYDYEALGRLNAQTFTWTGTGWVGNAMLYDAQGRLLRRTAPAGSSNTWLDARYLGEQVVYHGGGVIVNGAGVDNPLFTQMEMDNGNDFCYFITIGGRLLDFVEHDGNQCRVSYITAPDEGPSSAPNPLWGDVGQYAGAIDNSYSFDLSRAGNADVGTLSYFRNRWYDSQTGRFTQEDPIGVAGGLNLYAYSGSNPASYTDPFGLCPPPPGQTDPLCTAGNIAAGFGDAITFGFTSWVRGRMGTDDQVNTGSASYLGGTGAGVVAGFATGGAATRFLVGTARTATASAASARTLRLTGSWLQQMEAGRGAQVATSMRAMAETVEGRQQLLQVHQTVSRLIPGARTPEAANWMMTIQDISGTLARGGL